ELWTLDGVHREQSTGMVHMKQSFTIERRSSSHSWGSACRAGKCIGGLVCEGIGQDLVTGEKLLTLKRHPRRSRSSEQLPLKELPFTAGDRVIVSLDGHRSTSPSNGHELVDLEDCRISAAGQPLGYGVH